MRLIIIVVAVVVFSGHKSKLEHTSCAITKKIAGYTTSLMNNPPELQAQISALVKDFDESTRVITNGDVCLPACLPWRRMCIHTCIV